MSEEMKEKVIHAAPNRWLVFAVLVFSGGIAFKLGSLKDAFYVPMQQFMGLSHTQIGLAMSVYGIVQTVGLIFGIYICDRFSKKYMISFSLIGIGIVGLYIATFPPFVGFLISYALMAILAEVTYWPVLLKTIRLIGTEKDQGRMFGFLEAGRGVIDTIIAFSALAIFTNMGADARGLRFGILFYAGMTIVAGVLCFILVPNSKVSDVNKNGEKVGKNAVAFEGMVEVLKSLDIWIVALNCFVVYCIYCGLTYFIPFLNNVYKMPVAFVGAYGIINQYCLKMVGGPVGGFLSDKVFKSAAKYIRFAFVVAAVCMGIFIILPHEHMNVYLGMACTLGFGAIIFTMRAVFFAPMEEIKVPENITGSAMSLGCLICYLPNSFAYLIYGNLLDRHPGIAGYKIVFSIMMGCAIVGFFVSSYLIRRIKKKQK